MIPARPRRPKWAHRTALVLYAASGAVAMSFGVVWWRWLVIMAPFAVGVAIDQARDAPG